MRLIEFLTVRENKHYYHFLPNWWVFFVCLYTVKLNSFPEIVRISSLDISTLAGVTISQIKTNTKQKKSTYRQLTSSIDSRTLTVRIN